MRQMGFGLLAAFVLTLFPGCKISASTEQPQNERPKRIIASGPVTPTLPAADIVVRVHWLGRSRIAADTNSVFLMKIWDMPESAKLQAHVLDQFSLAPWRLLPGNTNFAVTNPASALLRPLLDDVVQQESWLEVYAPSNQPAQIAFAINLPPGRAALWQTNLALLTSSLPPLPSPLLSRSGDWTLLGWSQSTNVLIGDLSAHLSEWETSIASHPIKPWFEASLDLSRAAAALPLGWVIPVGSPTLELIVTGDGRNVLTQGTLNFPKRLPFDIEPWNIPTNLIHPPLESFMAVRGLRPCLSQLKMWDALRLSPPPNQFYSWSQKPAAFFTYAAAPLAGARGVVSNLTDSLLEDGNTWLNTNAAGQFLRSTEADGVDCTAGAPLIAPFLQSASGETGEFVFGGLGRGTLTNGLAPVALFAPLLNRTNLVLEEIEATSGRLGAWLYIGQALRVIFWKAQLPEDSAIVSWFERVAPRLGTCSTQVERSRPDQLRFVRTSAVGFNSIELHLFADWLESPTFPRGLHTFEAPGMVRPRPHHWTNSVPVPATNH